MSSGLVHAPEAGYGFPMATAEPVWAIAERFPRQGEWTERDYLALPEGYPRVELSEGRLEVLPMPTHRHQAVLTAVLLLLIAHARRAGGWALPAGIRVRLQSGRFREPDVAFLSRAHGELCGEEYWLGADLVVEVVSGGPDDRARDYATKRDEYARAGIAEYWIVDPQDGVITVLRLEGEKYVEHGVFRRGDRLGSATLPGVGAPVDELLDAE